MYVCAGCGRSLQGTKPAEGKCPTCNPPNRLEATGDRLRCSACGNHFDAPGTSPQVECPSCGVPGQRSVLRIVARGPVLALEELADRASRTVLGLEELARERGAPKSAHARMATLVSTPCTRCGAVRNVARVGAIGPGSTLAGPVVILLECTCGATVPVPLPPAPRAPVLGLEKLARERATTAQLLGETLHGERCTCADIQKSDPTRHFKGCSLRVESPLSSEAATAGRRAERATIVAWLRGIGGEARGITLACADSIEAGEHLKGT